jgi:hypothetical protein
VLATREGFQFAHQRHHLRLKRSQPLKQFDSLVGIRAKFKRKDIPQCHHRRGRKQGRQEHEFRDNSDKNGDR